MGHHLGQENNFYSDPFAVIIFFIIKFDLIPLLVIKNKEGKRPSLCYALYFIYILCILYILYV